MASLLPLLTVWLALKYAYGLGSCDNLKAFEESKEVNSSFFCVEEFTDEECLPFVGSFNRSHLPPAFHSHSLTIDKPSSINLDLLTLDYKDPRHQISYKSPGARLQWTPPVSELSRSKLEGFLILWNNEKTISCRLFKFNTSHQKLIKMMNFSYVVDNLHDDSQYTFTVYSLPPPEYKYRLDSNRFAQMIMKTFTKYESGTDPAFWAPSLSVKIWPSTGTLDVNFLLSPPEFNFTHYEIHLLKRSHSANDFYQMKNYSEISTNFNSQGNARFENLSTDSYQIKIIITDPFWQRPGQCYCWRRATQDECNEGVCSYMCSGGRCCQGSCKAVSTQWIKLDVVAEEISTLKLQETTETMNHDDSATPRTGEVSLQGVTGRLLSDGEIVGVVLGSAVIIIVFVSLIYIFLKPLSSTAVIKTLVCIKKFPHGESNSAIGSTTKSKELSASLAPKKLYMMSADDHDYHIQMVEKLVRFLELHCHCQVIYPANAKDFHKFDSPYSWFMSHISNSDHIICIISVGAQKLTEAYLNQKIFRDRELRPEGDLFTECLKHIYRDTLARDRVINIYFGPTEPELKYFLSPFTFDIPKNISEFFQKLHSLSSKDRRTFSSQLSMLRDNIPLIPEGAELLAAIKVSRQYEESNPDWLIKNFGVETDIKRAIPATSVNKTPPKLETMLSISSGDSGINDMGPRSVSASDLRSCRSPTGVEDHSGLHNELGLDQDKELELDIYTIPYSSYMDDHSDKSCASLNTTDTGHNPHSCSANPGSGTEYDHFIGTVVPPGNASERTELLRAPQMNINKPHILQTDRGIYSIENQMPLDCMLILPPETMSAIDNMSEAFLNINKNVDFYNKNQMPPDHMFILPPETMSTVDNMSEAFINVNKNIDNYNNWNNQQGHC